MTLLLLILLLLFLRGRGRGGGYFIESNVRLGIYFIKEAKIMYGCGLVPQKY